jgi:hypothetical protein
MWAEVAMTMRNFDKMPPNVDWLAQNVNVFRSQPDRLKRKQT